jgi:alpha-L-fucosidase
MESSCRQAIERIMPGRTSKRDLIGELADALSRRGIKLMLYYHCGYGDREWQTRNFGTNDANRIGIDALFRKNWIAITIEVGVRQPPRRMVHRRRMVPSPFEEQNRALKVGYPGRIVCFND